jgi:hypothetical protein
LTGFEHGLATISANGGGLADAITGTPVVQSTIVHSGSYALKLDASATNAVTKNISGTMLVGRLYFYYEALPTNDAMILRVGCASGAYCYFHYRPEDTPDHFYCGFNGNASDTASSITPVTGQWYRLDFRIDVSSNPYTVSWQIDGTAQTQHSYAAAATTLSTFNLRTGTGLAQIVYHDDVILSATSGDYPIGVGSIEGLRPTSDGTHNAGANVIEDNDGNDIGAVTAYDHLSKDPFSSSLGTYIKQSATGTGNYAEVNFADTSLSTIQGARALLQYRSSGTNANEGGCIVIDEDATETTVWGDPTTRADYSESSMFYKSAILPTPSGGWDAAAINALKARIGYSNGVADVPYWCALLIEVAGEGEPSSSESPSASPSVSPSASESPSVSPSLSPSASASPSESPSLSPSASASPSESQSKSPSESPSLSPSASASPSVSPSESPSESPSASPSASPSESPSLSPSASVSPSESPSASPSLSPSASVSPSPSPGWEGYSRGDYADLPADDADLETAYSAQDYLDVDAKDEAEVCQSATDEYAIHEFKDYAGLATKCTLEWYGQTSVDPATSPVYLQVYNQNTDAWETLDQVPALFGGALAVYGGDYDHYGSPGADTNFSLFAHIDDLTNYLTPGKTLSCRVYQLTG